jgi:RNA polymerase sigma-70 factor (ECF subfamily)
VNPLEAPDVPSTLSDAQVIARVRDGECALFEILMRRHNQRIYRTVRAIVRNEADVEEVMQRAYVNAFVHLHQFEERSRFSTWLTRIALNEAFAWNRRARFLNATTDADDKNSDVAAVQPDPERQAYAQEIRFLIEQAIDALPENYRLVFMLRDIEGLSTSETGEGLGLRDDVIKTRLHRARALLRRSVAARLGEVGPGMYRFLVPRCNRIVMGVFNRLAVNAPPSPQPHEVSIRSRTARSSCSASTGLAQ